MINSRQPCGNFILDSLPQAEYDHLRPHLQTVDLRLNEVLIGIDQSIEQVYFPINALVSLVRSTIEGDSVELGVTGYEGVVGLPLLLNHDRSIWEAGVQLAGRALCLNARVFAAMLPELEVLRSKVMDYTFLKLVQVSQSAVCNRFHTVEQRLCRWLLVASDSVQTPELALTREILASMIGANRPSVSIVTGTLQTAGLIRAVRGRVTILDREEMEEATCECYHVMKRDTDRYLQHSER
ncbi:hypothetical protein LEP3755_08290 [Leptolyngbya sp. NIES-3755]|nr:hypothetical protein LEP3755_08290 [Leptolyngbya sp. NIES-3755]